MASQSGGSVLVGHQRLNYSPAPQMLAFAPLDTICAENLVFGHARFTSPDVQPSAPSPVCTCSKRSNWHLLWHPDACFGGWMGPQSRWAGGANSKCEPATSGTKPDFEQLVPRRGANLPNIHVPLRHSWRTLLLFQTPGEEVDVSELARIHAAWVPGTNHATRSVRVFPELGNSDLDGSAWLRIPHISPSDCELGK